MFQVLLLCILFLIKIQQTIQCTSVPFYQCTDTINNFTIEIMQTSVNEKTTHTCCKEENIISKNNKNILTNCGLRNIDGLFMQVIGDKNISKYGEFPWMIMILEKVPVGTFILKRNICEGSLIHPKVVLTTGDCVRNIDLNNLIVRAGDWDAINTQEILDHEERNVTNILYQSNKKQSKQVALLLIDYSFELKLHIQTICLPYTLKQYTNDCLVTSWNHFKIDRKQTSVLGITELRLKQNTNRVKRLAQNNTIVQNSAKKCFLQNGSPIVCRVKNTKTYYTQVGILANNYKCDNTGRLNYLNIRIKNNYMWIHKELSKIE